MSDGECCERRRTSEEKKENQFEYLEEKRSKNTWFQPLEIIELPSNIAAKFACVSFLGSLLVRMRFIWKVASSQGLENGTGALLM